VKGFDPNSAEPESDDGLVTWNFFDRYLAAQWGNQPQPYPVYRLLEMPYLVTETVGDGSGR